MRPGLFAVATAFACATIAVGSIAAAQSSPGASPAGAVVAPDDAASHAEQSAEIGELRRAIAFDVGQRNVKTILIDGREVWIGSSTGAIRYDTERGSYLTYDNTSGLMSNGVFHLSKADGRIWIGTYGGGLSIFDPVAETWSTYNIPNGMGDAFVYDALVMENGDVWIATWSGANRIRGGNLDDIAAWDLFTVENTNGGLPNDWVYGLAAGRNGEVWLATEGGLARFENDQWTNWTHQDGLGAPIEAVEADPAFGQDPAASSSHHARQKQEQGLGAVKTAYNPNYVVALAVAENGDVWTGTWGAGLSRFDGDGWTTYTVSDGLPGNHIFALHTDERGRLWIGTNRGLAVRDGDRVSSFGAESGLNVESIFTIETDGDTAWVGGYGGVTWFPYGLTGLSGAGSSSDGG